jgi:glutamate racemase
MSFPIIVLDSGLGGLTVVKAIRSSLPREDVLYVGDTARGPYGWKSPRTVTTFVRQLLNHVRQFQPKHVILACHTASALTLPTLKAEFRDLPLSGVIEPAARAAIEAGGSKPQPIIGILATEATVWSKAYEKAIHRRRHHAKLLLRPAPLLAPVIEDGRDARDPLVKMALRQYLTPLVMREIDVLLLACTHYPLLLPAIANMVGPKVAVIDSSQNCAEDVARRLAATGQLRGGDGPTGTLRCLVTDDSPNFRTMALRFLGEEPEPPTWISPEELVRTAPPPDSGLRVPA